MPLVDLCANCTYSRNAIVDAREHDVLTYTVRRQGMQNTQALRRSYE